MNSEREVGESKSQPIAGNFEWLYDLFEDLHRKIIVSSDVALIIMKRLDAKDTIIAQKDSRIHSLEDGLKKAAEALTKIDRFVQGYTHNFDSGKIAKKAIDT